MYTFFYLLYIRTVLMDELLNNKIADCYDNNKIPFLWDRQLTRVGVRIHGCSIFY